MQHETLTASEEKTCSLFNKNGRRNARQRRSYEANAANAANANLKLNTVRMDSAICRLTHALPDAHVMSQNTEFRTNKMVSRYGSRVRFCLSTRRCQRARNCELFGAGFVLGIISIETSMLFAHTNDNSLFCFISIFELHLISGHRCTTTCQSGVDSLCSTRSSIENDRID